MRIPLGTIRKPPKYLVNISTLQYSMTTTSDEITIDGDIHPPIVLKGEWGELKNTISTVSGIINLQDNAKAALEDGLTLRGGGANSVTVG
jgi:hypothetical protein